MTDKIEVKYVIKEKEYTANIPVHQVDHFIDGLIKSGGKIKSEK